MLAIGVPIYDQSRIALFGAFLFLPCLVSLVLCELQVLLFFWLTPVLAFMMVFGYLIAAVFFQHPAFLGNFAMLYRQTWISENSALDLGTGMLLCILLSGAAFVIGMVLFERKDILSQQGE